MTTYVPPYTVTVTSTAGGLAQCSYVDGTGKSVPAGTVLTTTSKPGEQGEMPFKFAEATVEGQSLRLVGAAVKTVGNDPTMHQHNYLYADRTESNGVWTDEVTVTWAADSYTRRGVVLLFAQVNLEGDMMNFYPTMDPQTQNDQT